MTEGCEYFHQNQCRSCSLIKLSYDDQCKHKEQRLAKLFADADLHCAKPISAIVRANNPFHSRNKAKFVIEGTARTARFTFFGSAAPETDFGTCPLHLSSIQALIPDLRGLIAAYDLTPYLPETRAGELKAIIIRASETTGDLMVRFIMRSVALKSTLQRAARALQTRHPEVKVVSLNLQPIPHTILEGEHEEILSDRAWIEEQGTNFTLRMSPQSFFQVTTNVAWKLYDTAMLVIDRYGTKQVVDLYCGIGGFALAAARTGAHVSGFEISSAAINDAKRNAEVNGITQALFNVADVDMQIPVLRPDTDCVIVNPPRRGVDELVLKELNAFRPKIIVYSSCYPESLVRDLRILSENYALSEVVPFDMFPLTEHFETFVVLTRLS